MFTYNFVFCQIRLRIPGFHLFEQNIICDKNVMQGKLIAVAYTLRTYC